MREDLPIESRPMAVLSEVVFTGAISGEDFRSTVFRDTGSKRIEFRDCDFSYCRFERAYFHSCTFINCKFIGARFADSNFRRATFEGCGFEYAVFHRTLIPHRQLLANLPAWPNVRRELSRALRINFESVGDAEAVKEFVREELSASREHLKKAREGKESYYGKYRKFPKMVRVYWDSFWVWLDWNVWGHGEYPAKLLRSIGLILVAAVAWEMYSSKLELMTMSIPTIGSWLVQHGRDVVYSFLGVKVDTISDGMSALLGLTRYVTLGLFISVLYKRLSRR